MWDVASGKPVGPPMQHQGTVYALAFRPPDGRVFVTGSEDGTARLWDSVTGQPMGAPFPHPAPVLAVAFSPDGTVFATGCQDGNARLWDAATRHPLWLPLPHRSSVRTLAFKPETESSGEAGRRRILLTGSEDKTARVWEITDAVAASSDRIMLALQVANGMSLDSQGAADSLVAAKWQRLRHELDGQRDAPAHAEPASQAGGR
jgi:WD40 repeat protein